MEKGILDEDQASKYFSSGKVETRVLSSSLVFLLPWAYKLTAMFYKTFWKIFNLKAMICYCVFVIHAVHIVLYKSLNELIKKTLWLTH